MEQRIVLIYKGDLLEIPLLLSVCRICAVLNCQVEVICGYCSFVTKRELSDIGVNIIVLASNLPRLKKNSITKLVYWARFRSFIKSASKNFPQNCIVWLGSGDTAIALYGIKLNNSFVLHLHELYDENTFYRLVLRKISKSATVIVCPERCRAAIFQVWFKLKETPFTLPNSVYSHPRRRNLVKDSELIEQVQVLIGGRKVLLYQGHIGSDRSFLEFARAIGAINDQWVLIVMGKSHDETLDLLRINCPNLIYIPHITPPGNLDVTSLATIGIIMYTASSLNNIFCAPNKIWEYAGYGIPFISNKLPALQNILFEYKCGICVDETKENILNALNEIECNYVDYSDAATRLFDSINLQAIVKQIINKCSNN